MGYLVITLLFIADYFEDDTSYINSSEGRFWVVKRALVFGLDHV